ncbi:MAG: META domain-containing protein [Pseudomonadota bacterium]
MRWILLFANLSLASCGPDETISGQVAPEEVFVLERLAGTPVTTRITITFPEKGQVAGQAPCNRYFAAQKAPLPWFELGPIGATKRACPELKLEARYLRLLATMSLIERAGDVLILNNDADQMLEFRRTPE